MLHIFCDLLQLFFSKKKTCQYHYPYLYLMEKIDKKKPTWTILESLLSYPMRPIMSSHVSVACHQWQHTLAKTPLFNRVALVNWLLSQSKRQSTVLLNWYWWLDTVSGHQCSTYPLDVVAAVGVVVGREPRRELRVPPRRAPAPAEPAARDEHLVCDDTNHDYSILCMSLCCTNENKYTEIFGQQTYPFKGSLQHQKHK